MTQPWEMNVHLETIIEIEEICEDARKFLSVDARGGSIDPCFTEDNLRIGIANFKEARCALHKAVLGSHDIRHKGSGCERICGGKTVISDGLLTEPCHRSQGQLIASLFQRKKRAKKISMLSPAIARFEVFKSIFQPRTRWPVHPELHQEVGIPPIDWRKPSWRVFDYQELADATDGFSSENLVSKGGHAEVYKGCLADGEVVAVKKLLNKAEEERGRDLLSELGTIAHVDHPNVIRLLGFGVENGLYLVFNFCQHGDLASNLLGLNGKEKLDWRTRSQIATGVAKGLLYLHQGCHRRIIHRDIKASNILLAKDYQPQISDFGLAKWLPTQWTQHVAFPIEGTIGYLAPEYFMHGVVSEKTDVFSFGVLQLELITGRLAVNSSQESVVIWAKPLLAAKEIKGLIDPHLKGACDYEEISRCLSAASACIHQQAMARPSMNEVVLLLNAKDVHDAKQQELKISN